jgi:acyl-CoA synthetase (AMP-forming)/AMP-acid ligase II
MRIIDFLYQSSALENNDRKFIDLNNDFSLTYPEMYIVSGYVAELLKDNGVKPNDVVATYADNSVTAYCCIFAISMVGAIWLPINVKNTLNANIKLLKKSKAVKVFVNSDILTSRPQLLEHFSDNGCIPFDGQSVFGVNIPSLLNISSMQSKYGNVNIKRNGTEEVDYQQLVNLFPTGGTTGDSKLAEWSNLTWSVMSDIQIKLMPPPDIPACYLVAAPMTHAAGIASFVPILQGASILVMGAMDPEVLLPAIGKYQVTHLFLPPTAIYMLLAHNTILDHDYSSLRYFWYAAAPMSEKKLCEAIMIFGPVMMQTYGQAEAPMICTCMTAHSYVEAMANNNTDRLRSCGKVSPGVEIEIVDNEGNFLSAGNEGEIIIRGDLLMRGYYDNPEATLSIRKEGWQYSGDIGVFDKEGYLSIVDRKNDMIISGGFNVYPGEVEQVLWSHPEIQDCAVIGIPDDKWGEKVVAVIELKDKYTALEELKVIAYCKKYLGSIKAPKQVFIWESLPRSPVGKVLKKDIRKSFWAGIGRKI